MRKLALLVVLVVLAAVAWRLWQGSQAPAVASAVPKPASAATTLPPASVLAVRPHGSETPSAGVPASLSAQALKRPPSADMAQFRARKDLAGLQARLASAAPTAETRYLQAALYALCATRGPRFPGEPPQEPLAVRRAQFIASISQSSKDQIERLDAFDRQNANPCAGLDMGAFDAVELQKQLTAAAELGDTRAQAWLLADRIEHRTPAEYGKPTSGNTMTAADLDSLRNVLVNGDAETLQYVRGAIASTLEHGELRIDGESFDPMAMNTALQLLACDAGANCGPDAYELLDACARRGRCGVSNLYDYAYFYGHSPNESQLLDAYRQRIAQMLATGNFSGLTLTAIDPPRGSTFMFGISRP